MMACRANQVADYHQSCGDAYARLEGRVGLQAADCSHQFQPRAHGSLCVVFVGLGVAEINQNAVAHVLRYEPAEATHGVRDALLVGRNDFA